MDHIWAKSEHDPAGPKLQEPNRAPMYVFSIEAYCLGGRDSSSACFADCKITLHPQHFPAKR